MTNEKTLLSYISKDNLKNRTILDYKNFLKEKNKMAIAEMVYDRLYYRYIHPFEMDCMEYKKNYKNGFSMMASFCLLIETIQCFKEGQNDGKGLNGEYNYEILFKNFFEEQKKFFEGIDGEDFYKDIRCGILHQGEIKNGWILRRDKDVKCILYPYKTIQVNNFMNALKKVLENYKNELIESSFTSKKWKNLIDKMEFIIENCSIKNKNKLVPKTFLERKILNKFIGNIKHDIFCKFKNDILSKIKEIEEILDNDKENKNSYDYSRLEEIKFNFEEELKKLCKDYKINSELDNDKLKRLKEKFKNIIKK